MGSAIFVSTESELPGLELSIDGKALAKNENALSSRCEGMGVTPLIAFLCPSVAAQRAALASFGITDVSPIPATWFTAAEGMPTVVAMLRLLADEPEWYYDVPALRRDIERLREILTALEPTGVRWHLDIDF